jgi:hypothetical protein
VRRRKKKTKWGIQITRRGATSKSPSSHPSIHSERTYAPSLAIMEGRREGRRRGQALEKGRKRKEEDCCAMKKKIGRIDCSLPCSLRKKKRK